MSYKPTRYRNAEERAEKAQAEQDERDRMAELLAASIAAEVPRRAAAYKPDLLARLEDLAVAVDNLRGAITAAHTFDVRALSERLRFALGEIDAAERRVVDESGLEVS